MGYTAKADSTGPILRIAYSKIVQVVLLVQTRTTTSTTLVQACTTSTRLVQVQPCASLYAKYAKYSYKAALYKLYKLVQVSCTAVLHSSTSLYKPVQACTSLYK